jgi:hypothetical protein
MSQVGFESTIPAVGRAKTVHALDRAATVTGNLVMPGDKYNYEAHYYPNFPILLLILSSWVQIFLSPMDRFFGGYAEGKPARCWQLCLLNSVAPLTVTYRLQCYMFNTKVLSSKPISSYRWYVSVRRASSGTHTHSFTEYRLLRDSTAT